MGAKPKKPQQLFKAKTMGDAQRGEALKRARKESRAAVQNTSTVKVLRPDEQGNLVEVEVVAPVFTRPAKKKRPKVPRGAKSLL